MLLAKGKELPSLLWVFGVFTWSLFTFNSDAGTQSYYQVESDVLTLSRCLILVGSAMYGVNVIMLTLELPVLGGSSHHRWGRVAHSWALDQCCHSAVFALKKLLP